MGAWRWLCRAEGQTSTRPANLLCPSWCVELPLALTRLAQSPARDTQEPFPLSQATLTTPHSCASPSPASGPSPGLLSPSGPSFFRSSHGYIPLNWMLSSHVALILPRAAALASPVILGLSLRDCPFLPVAQQPGMPQVGAG